MVVGEVLPGDWTCSSCNINNFARRTTCVDCKLPKDSSGIEHKDKSVTDEQDEPEKCDVEDAMDDKECEEPRNTDKGASQEIREGDWSCNSCGANNFARRQACFKCKANKDGVEDKFEFRNGDWSCSACGTHNFARRSACFQCRKQRPDGSDWICMSCSMNNFARRAYCFGCQSPKYQSDRDSNRYHGNHSNPYYNNGYNDYHRGPPPPPPRGGGMVPAGRNPVRNGDWICSSCNYHNFARRDTCNKCEASKGDNEVVQDRRQGVQPGDWICEPCGENNFARRTKCFKCEEPKPEQDD